MSQPPVGGIQQTGGIQQRTDPGQTRPQHAGQLIIEHNPEGDVDLSFKGGNDVKLPEVTDRAISVIAQENPEFKPITNSPEASMALANMILAQPQNDQLRNNPNYQAPMAQPVPEGETVFGRDLKAGIGKILEKFSLGELQAFVAQTAGDLQAAGLGDSNKLSSRMSPRIPGTGLPSGPEPS